MQDGQRQSKPAAANRSPATGAPPAVAALVRERLGQDPLWSHFALNGAWICPYCLSAVRGHDETRSALVRAVEGHLARRCTGWRNGAGRPQSADGIASKRAFEDITHRALTDPAWQVFDHEGFWYSPSSLQRVTNVRLVNGRFDSFTIQNMAAHLARCPHFQAGRVHAAPDVQRARDQLLRAQQLTTNLRQLVQFPLWRYTDAAGQWVCPFCLAHLADLVLATEADWQSAPERMAWHLASACPAYVPERPEPKLEALVRQAAQQGVPVARPPSGGHPLAPRPATSRVAMPVLGADGARTATPVGRPVARPTPPSGGELRTPLPMAGGPLPIATPLPFSASPPPGTGPLPIATPVPGTRAIARPIGQKAAPPPAPTPPPPLIGGDPLALFDQMMDPPASAAGDEQLIAAEDADDSGTDSGIALTWMDQMEATADTSATTTDPATDTERVRARDVQQGLLTKVPQLPGYRFATRFEACHDISGDFYEFIQLDDGRIGFAQGDVSGHGIHAGLIMSMAKKTVAIYARAGGGPADVLSQVNDSLVDDLGGRIFISMTYAILDPGMGTITWARAGHNPTIRFNRHTGEMSELKPKGMVVGMKKGPIFRGSMQEEITRLDAGDVFLVYTDGITETMNRQKVEYGVELLMEVVRRHAAAGPEVLLDRILDSIRQFRGGSTADDDSTLLALAVD